MKALVLDEHKILSIKELTKPAPSEGEVLINIKAAALNHRELWITKGLYPGMTLPCVLGADGAGVVTELGEGVSDEWRGKEVIIYPAYDWGDNAQIPEKRFRVLGMPDPGTIAEYIVVPVENIVEKPSHLSWESAAAIPVASLTAWRALTVHGVLKKGDNVLITGIGGGVAQAGLSFALSIGANVYVTSSKEDKIANAISLGAKGGVNYKKKDWNLELKQLSGGIDVVLDSSPASDLNDYLRFLNMGARIVAYGSTGSRSTELNISKFFLRHIQFIGTTMGSPIDFRAMMDYVDKHEICPIVDSIFNLDESIDAMQTLASGNQIGKVVIVI